MKSDIESKATLKVKTLLWPLDRKFIAVQFPECVFSNEELERTVLEKHVLRSYEFLHFLPFGKHCLKRWIRKSKDTNYMAQSENLQAHMVKVKMIDISWLFTNQKTFLEFAQSLACSGRNDLYMTDFVKIMLDVYWTDNKKHIFWKIFVPYCIYLILALFYWIQVICKEHEHPLKFVIAPVLLVFIIYQIYVEVMQLLYHEDPDKFLRYFWRDGLINIADLGQYTLTFSLVVLSLFEVDFPSYEHRRVFASILVFILWAKILDWMRMFDSTAFYIKLVFATVKGIWSFLLIYFVILISFGCAMICLSMNRDDSDSQIIESYFNNWFIDSVINQYLLGLGEFSDLDTAFGGS